LVATGEHYVFDILLGWFYAAAVLLAWNWWDRRKAAARSGMPGAGVVAEGPDAPPKRLPQWQL
jgi:hypothetical protein